MVVEVAQVLDALAIQPLRLIDDQQPLAAGEQADQLLGELESVRTPGIGAGQLPIQAAGDVQHRRAARELHPRSLDLELGDRELGSERLARPRRTVHHPQRTGRQHSPGSRGGSSSSSAVCTTLAPTRPRWCVGIRHHR